MEYSDLLYKLHKYQKKLEFQPSNIIYQQKVMFYYDLIGGGKKRESKLIKAGIPADAIKDILPFSKYFIQYKKLKYFKIIEDYKIIDNNPAQYYTMGEFERHKRKETLWRQYKKDPVYEYIYPETEKTSYQITIEEKQKEWFIICCKDKKNDFVKKIIIICYSEPFLNPSPEDQPTKHTIPSKIITIEKGRLYINPYREKPYSIRYDNNLKIINLFNDKNFKDIQITTLADITFTFSGSSDQNNDTRIIEDTTLSLHDILSKKIVFYNKEKDQSGNYITFNSKRNEVTEDIYEAHPFFSGDDFINIGNLISKQKIHYFYVESPNHPDHKIYFQLYQQNRERYRKELREEFKQERERNRKEREKNK